MKAITFNKYGTPDVLQFEDIEKPVPNSDEVLLKVHASCINSYDYDFLRGTPKLFRLLFGISKPKINVLGCDIAGTVEEVGSEVKHLKPGDEVYGDVSVNRWGGFSEYTCAKESLLALKPPDVTFGEAAATAHTAVLALQALRDKHQVKPGDKVLFNGAGGGVGTFGIQLAKHYNAEVTCVDKGSKLPKLKDLGADHVIDYESEDFSKNGVKYDLIVDVIGNYSLFKFRKLLSPTGSYVMIGGRLRVMFQILFFSWFLSAKKGRRLGVLGHVPNGKDLEFINELFETGKIKPLIDSTFSLEEVPEAFRHFGKTAFTGKIVIEVATQS